MLIDVFRQIYYKIGFKLCISCVDIKSIEILNLMTHQESRQVL